MSADHHRVARAALGCARLLIIPALLVPFWYWDNGLLELEATQFVQRYLADRPLLQKIFDPHINDIGTYQARELSYFIDYLDARFFAWWMSLDVAVFVPASSVVAGVLTALLVVRHTRGWDPGRALIATLLLLAYATNFIYVVTSGMLYRSTKPLLAPVLIATVFYLHGLLTRLPPSPWRPPAGVFGLFCLLSLLDRQGFFLAVVGAAVIGLYWLAGRASMRLLLAGVAAVLSMVAYNVAIGPALIRALNGYTPSFRYQNVPLLDVLTTPQHFARAAEILWQATRVLTGNLPSLALVALMAVALWRVHRTWRPAAGTADVLAVAALPAAFLLMFAIMIARHPAIYELRDHRLWYYPLPWQALLLAVGVIAVGQWREVGTTSVRWLAIALVLVAVTNVLQWKAHRGSMFYGEWFRVVYTQSAALKASLSDGRARPSLAPEYADFYQFCLRLSPALRLRDSETRTRGRS